jgi:hypothetical protein
MPSTIGSVLVLIGFVIPGFITAWLWTLAYPRVEPGEGRLILEGLALSCVNYGIWSWLLVLAWKLAWYERVGPSIALVAFVLFISPVLLGIALVRVSESNWLRELRPRIGLASPVPRAWDHFFRKSGPCWVLATLKSGQVVGGLYGPDSAASSYPADEELYLERMCELSPSGEMDRIVANSKGAIIRMVDVQLLEFFDLNWAQGDI